MDAKSAVSTLQEFCAKTKTGPPEYNYIDNEDGGFICKVALLDMEAYGNGRSKRDAKHLSAANILRKVRKLPGCREALDMIDADDDNEVTNLNRDMLKELRDYCVRHEMPLPVIEIVQQSGSPNAPEFVACCTVASITRYGKSDKKKDARQRAAIEMLNVITKDGDKVKDPHGMQLVGINTAEDEESQRRQIFSTYREVTESGVTECNAVQLRDRHNYFKNFHSHLKSAALEILDPSKNDEYLSDKDRALSVMSALKLSPKITAVPALSMEPMLQIEFNCDYDGVLLGFESQIYNGVLQYFREMLV
ncbi:RISC-loading complex subunit tarbp2 [Drosophila tropicalis]|uniref:RISC-loading complex subunit tarbp2 n=1 Tax=Drosophila tropicalis TaxID=46794 RepID=UPI0035ABC9AF